jgi:hypothetical protein
MANRDYAEKLLDRLVELDYQTVEAYYDMGSIISSMRHGKLYETLGYDSMAHLVEEELTFGPSTASRYASMFRHFKRLHYSKPEAIELLKKFGLTHMADVLPKMSDKIGQRAIKNRIDALDQHQINFTLTRAELEKTNRALLKNGAVMGELGRWKNSSEAFMEMVNQHSNGRPKLKAVG